MNNFVISIWYITENLADHSVKKKITKRSIEESKKCFLETTDLFYTLVKSASADGGMEYNRTGRLAVKDLALSIKMNFE